MGINRCFVFRILFYACGLLCLAFAVALSINSNLGIAPVNALPYVLSLVLNKDMSICVIAVFSFYILLQILLLRKRFRWYNIFQLAFSTLFGYFVDFAQWIVGDFCVPSFWGRLLMLAGSLVLIGIGISLYVDTRLIPMPA